MVKFGLKQGISFQMIVAILIAVCAVAIAVGFLKLTWGFWTDTVGLQVNIPFLK